VQPTSRQGCSAPGLSPRWCPGCVLRRRGLGRPHPALRNLPDQTVVVRSDLWQIVHAERAALVADLAGLRNDLWATPSLCHGWDVRDIVAHLAATATLSYPGFVKEFLLAGLSSGRIVDKQVRLGRTRTPAELLSALRSAIDSTASPPQPTITRLIEIIVHGEDIRRPLHIRHDYSTTHIAEALDYLASDRRSGGKTRLAGLRLQATDATFAVGEGSRVEGPAVSLLLVATGRRVALADLTGPGRRRLE
jgi:uncharacterized protein (TIGR03083 family)